MAQAAFRRWLGRQQKSVKTWVAANTFSAEPGTVCLLPDKSGGIDQVLFGADSSDPWCWAALPSKLPAATYRIDRRLTAQMAFWAPFAWSMALYRFDRYKSAAKTKNPLLVWPASADRALVARMVSAHRMVRDLVNVPAGDLGPAELAKAAVDVGHKYGAKVGIIVGEDLLTQNYPAIHTVGRAASGAPRLIDLVWGKPKAPKVTLVGKGVCFDSGGLDIKPSSGMKLMKKDMGGAAHALALASMIMDAGLKVRLRVLIPAVENAVAGNAMHPLDVIKMRSGKTVEIGNTDAEGRLILADCLTEADSESPALLIDFATLTGAARSALGPELPALFTTDGAFAAELQASANSEADPFWRLPLWRPYRGMLDSKVADINSAPDSGFAGAITAALFLKDFVTATKSWAHLDLYSWNATARPGRPVGGEAMTIRALYHLLAARYPA
jgi:leucyl aminopeptidase